MTRIVGTIGRSLTALRIVGGEISAIGAATLSFPFGRLLYPDLYVRDATLPPVVFVHGFLGDASNFVVMRRQIAARGARSFASFSYRPPLDYHTLAARLGEKIDTVRDATGAAQVDVVGHSFGGFLARHLVDTDNRGRVRRLVTLGSPYLTTPNPPQELAIFAANDLIVPAPGSHYVHGRHLVVPVCGHLALLYHPMVLRAVAGFLHRKISLLPRSRPARGHRAA